MKSRIKFILLLLLITSSSFAADGTCLDSRLVHDIRKSIALNTVDNANFDLCKSDSNTYKVLEALSLLKSIKFTAGKMKAPLNQQILPKDFWSYFKTRAKQIRDEGPYDPLCRKGSYAAYVYRDHKDGVIHLCPAFYDRRENIYTRIDIMLHEVRHFEGYNHVTCTRGGNSGLFGGCDERISDKGSYAVSVESTAKMAILANNIPLSSRAMLKIATLNRANNAFNETVFPNGFTAVLLQNSQQNYIYDGTTLFEAPPLPVNGKILSRKENLVLFPEDNSDAFSVEPLTDHFRVSAALGGAALSYNNQSQNRRLKIKDILNTKYHGCWILDDTLDCGLHASPAQRLKATLNFQAKALFSGDELGLVESDAVFIRSNKNKLYYAQIDHNEIRIEETEDFAKGFQTLVVFNEIRRIGLSDSGEFLEMKNEWTPVPTLTTQRFESMTRPFYWTEYFNP